MRYFYSQLNDDDFQASNAARTATSFSYGKKMKYLTTCRIRTVE